MYVNICKVDNSFWVINHQDNMTLGVLQVDLISNVDLNHSELEDIRGRPLNKYKDRLIVGIKRFKTQELVYYINHKLNEYLAGYTSADIHSWRSLEEEAVSYLYNPDIESPLLSKMAKFKDQGIIDVIIKVLNDKKQYDTLMFAYSLVKEHLICKITECDVDQLYALNVFEEVDKFIEDHSKVEKCSFVDLRREVLSRNNYLEMEIAKLKETTHASIKQKKGGK